MKNIISIFTAFFIIEFLLISCVKDSQQELRKDEVKESFNTEKSNLDCLCSKAKSVEFYTNKDKDYEQSVTFEVINSGNCTVVIGTPKEIAMAEYAEERLYRLRMLHEPLLGYELDIIDYPELIDYVKSGEVKNFTKRIGRYINENDRGKNEKNHFCLVAYCEKTKNLEDRCNVKINIKSVQTIIKR